MTLHVVRIHLARDRLRRRIARRLNLKHDCERR
jgi:hypothetical protein